MVAGTGVGLYMVSALEGGFPISLFQKRGRLHSRGAEPKVIWETAGLLCKNRRDFDSQRENIGEVDSQEHGSSWVYVLRYRPNRQFSTVDDTIKKTATYRRKPLDNAF